jgi:hypothetical protein
MAQLVVRAKVASPGRRLPSSYHNPSFFEETFLDVDEILWYYRTASRSGLITKGGGP